MPWRRAAVRMVSSGRALNSRPVEAMRTWALRVEDTEMRFVFDKRYMMPDCG